MSPVSVTDYACGTRAMLGAVPCTGVSVRVSVRVRVRVSVRVSPHLGACPVLVREVRRARQQRAQCGPVELVVRRAPGLLQRAQRQVRVRVRVRVRARVSLLRG